MSEIAYLITNDHFKVEEVDFEKLKSYTNNIILKYDVNSHSFRRALFELDRLDFNIGIYADILTGLDHEIKGFKIKLGLWLNEDIFCRMYHELNDKRNFITGVVTEDDFFTTYPRWGIMGDIENSKIIIYNKNNKIRFY